MTIDSHAHTAISLVDIYRDNCVREIVYGKQNALE